MAASAPTKQQQVYEVLRERILSGAYGPGFRVVIDQVAAEFAVSALPVREAIRRLEAEGLIVYRRQRRRPGGARRARAVRGHDDGAGPARGLRHGARGAAAHPRGPHRAGAVHRRHGDRDGGDGLAGLRAPQPGVSPGHLRRAARTRRSCRCCATSTGGSMPSAPPCSCTSPTGARLGGRAPRADRAPARGRSAPSGSRRWRAGTSCAPWRASAPGSASTRRRAAAAHWQSARTSRAGRRRGVYGHDRG